MSLSREALGRIEELVAAGLKIEGTWTQPVALPAGVTIHDLEQYQKYRYQFRGSMKTECIKDFIEYCNGQNTGSCFINREDMRANAIFDVGTLDKPGHCKHTSFLELQPTAAFMAMKRKFDKRISQQDLAEFIEDWREIVQLSDESVESIPISAGIAAIRKVTIKTTSDSEHKVGSFSESASSMDQLDASSGENNLPSYLDFTCESHHGLKERGFTMRISLIITGDRPEFILRPIKFDVTMEKASDEFRDIIKKDLSKDIPQYMGYFDQK